MPAKGRPTWKFQKRKFHGNRFCRPVPNHFHSWGQPITDPPSICPSDGETWIESSSLQSHSACPCFKWHTVITEGCHRDFAKSAEQGKSQRVRRMNDLPWDRAHINGGLQPRAYSAVSHLGSGRGPQSSSPRPRNKWLFSSFRPQLQCPLFREVSPHNRLPFESPALHPFHFQNRTLIIPSYRLFVA